MRLDRDAEDQARWNQRYSESPSSWIEPDTFLISAYNEFLAGKPRGLALGLAREKFKPVLQESSAQPGAPPPQPAQHRRDLGTPAAALHTGELETQVVDLNSVEDLGKEQYDLITVFYFLRSQLFPAIARALRPGGTLIYRTYTIDRMKVPGGPSDPQYLLQPNELLHAFAEMRVLHYHEMTEGKAAAELVSRKPD